MIFNLNTNEMSFACLFKLNGAICYETHRITCRSESSRKRYAIEMESYEHPKHLKDIKFAILSSIAKLFEQRRVEMTTQDEDCMSFARKDSFFSQSVSIPVGTYCALRKLSCIHLIFTSCCLYDNKRRQMLR